MRHSVASEHRHLAVLSSSPHMPAQVLGGVPHRAFPAQSTVRARGLEPPPPKGPGPKPGASASSATPACVADLRFYPAQAERAGASALVPEPRLHLIGQRREGVRVRSVGRPAAAAPPTPTPHGRGDDDAAHPVGGGDGEHERHHGARAGRRGGVEVGAFATATDSSARKRRPGALVAAILPRPPASVHGEPVRETAGQQSVSSPRRSAP